jgi:hypothetical protein
VETREIGTKLGEGGIESVGYRMEPKRADPVAVPEVDGEPAIREVEHETARTNTTKLGEGGGAITVLVWQCGDGVGRGTFGDTDVFDHAGRDDGGECVGAEGKPSGIGDYEMPTTEALLNPPRQAIQRVVDANSENALLAELTDAVAVATPNVEDGGRENAEPFEIRNSVGGCAGLEFLGLMEN